MGLIYKIFWYNSLMVEDYIRKVLNLGNVKILIPKGVFS